jgi:sulfatase modifying factor 1
MGWQQTTLLFGLSAACIALPGCREGEASQPSGEAATAARTGAASDRAQPHQTASVATPGASTGTAGKGESQAEASAEPPAERRPPDGMVKVPAGIYLMGAHQARGNPEEKPSHEAIVAGFYLDQTEVTFAAYQGCLGAGACTATQGNNPFCNHKTVDRGNHPINCVDLHQASAYCAWAGKRLPTEREWEYAASAGTERRRFSWGEADPTPARCCYNHPGGTCPVASFEPTAFGLHDMTGNVWEWTASVFAPYPSKAQPDEIRAGRHYVYRGGSWSRRFPKWMRNLIRNRYAPDQLSAAIGMRCARSTAAVECAPETVPRDGECVRTSGTVLCEPGYAFDGERCSLHHGAAAAVAAQRPGGPVATTDRGAAPPVPPSPSSGGATPTITRSRTPAKDPDCRRNWPATPAAYMFRGGHNYPSRKPAVSAAGCVPRDMGWEWTSACCPG